MIKIYNNIFWNGVIDWDLKRFHGHELSTHRGSSYNSYIIKDRQTVLVDTVWYPYKEEYTARVDKEVGIENIDMVVLNHMEPDHGGSLGAIMEKNPNITIVCTKNGEEIIRKYYQKDWKFKTVKTGDSIKIGEYELVFIEMKMLHWPDSMMTYVKGPGILFSNDAFGQHYAAVSLFNDEVDECELYQEAIKYYANILTPFNSLIKKKIEEVRVLNLSINMIAPSHGVIWRQNPLQIVDKYYQWCLDYTENFTAIIYDTMYDSTKSMAEAIAQGLLNKGMKYRLFNASLSDTSDLITEMFKATGIIIGCCTVNNTYLRSIAGIVEEIKAHRLKYKKAAAFGSYGWSGEAHKKINDELKSAGLEVMPEPISFRYKPSKDELKECILFGERFVEFIRGRQAQ